MDSSTTMSLFKYIFMSTWAQVCVIIHIHRVRTFPCTSAYVTLVIDICKTGVSPDVRDQPEIITVAGGECLSALCLLHIWASPLTFGKIWASPLWNLVDSVPTPPLTSQYANIWKVDHMQYLKCFYVLNKICKNEGSKRCKINEKRWSIGSKIKEKIYTKCLKTVK